MKYDITIFPEDLGHAADIARQVEAFGYDGLWTAEVAHNPFFPLVLGAGVTQRINLGTQIAVAFPRSPMMTANIAWDLAALSKGRFILGLGTQVRAHIERRFSTEWRDPVGRLREYIESLRAIWNAWQNEAPLRYRGEHYSFTLMTPFFNPGPIENPDIPIYIAGVNEKICTLAGEICQGLHAHGFHTVRYLREIVMANVEAGLKKAGRSRSDFELVVPIFTVTGHNDASLQKSVVDTKARIAFYASTPAYKVVMDLHGWGEIGDKLSYMARKGKWDEMWQHVSDEMLEEIAVVATPQDLPAKLQARYGGLADRICFGWESDDTDGREFWKEIAEVLKTT